MNGTLDMLLALDGSDLKQAKALWNTVANTERIKLERRRARLKYEQEHLESEQEK